MWLIPSREAREEDATGRGGHAPGRAEGARGDARAGRLPRPRVPRSTGRAGRGRNPPPAPPHSHAWSCGAARAWPPEGTGPGVVARAALSATRLGARPRGLRVRPAPAAGAPGRGLALARRAVAIVPQEARAARRLIGHRMGALLSHKCCNPVSVLKLSQRKEKI